jgi:predicted enzyme related to lactoylglutathione lyase
MTLLKLIIGVVLVSGLAAEASAQDTEARVWGIRVLATDPEAIAAFYSKAFGMAEIQRPVNSATTKEIVLNFGATPDAAAKSTSTPIVIYTRPRTAPAGAMASLILRVPDLDRALAGVVANGGSVLRPPATNGPTKLTFVFVKDPDGNQIELVTETK